MKESRRDFIKKSGSCALGMAAMATQMHHLGTMTAMAQKVIDSQPDGGANYKALVLLYWDGGNDTNNMVIPMHNDANVSNYAAYAAERSFSGLALTQGQLTNTQINVPRLGLPYALHPALGIGTAGAINNGIHELYTQGKLAIVANVGTLVRPLTKAQYQSSAFAKPYQIGSHSDQKSQFQTSVSNTQAYTGWGGRVSDKLTASQNPSGLVPMITSIAGAQLFTSGQTTLPIAIADAGTGANNLNSVLNPAGFGTSPTGSTLARLNAFNSLRTQDLNSNYISAASHVTDLAMQANAALQTSQEVTVPFPTTTGIGRQLKQVARLIKSRDTLNVNRQIFYVQIGGFDTHTNQLGQQTTLYSQFSQAMRAFYDEMVVQGVSNDVTTFTMSEFGRTFNPAGTAPGTVGSDHGWGSHMFVMGGSVAGGDVYGSRRPDATGSGNYFPTLTKAGLDDADSGTGARGRWIPTTSVDQYSAQFAKWFGLPQDAATLATVFPNLANFNTGTFPSLNFLP
ncbi:MAG TPA: DUF1501 domain-containing protein [Pyrinomonadaceae bacterium]|nr:DUF1501 domain-containing protein [Acidobacteriota bacterium]HQZ98042.1 DUF1501 domain-containing protein [Pyrinomonadaceae bacterium]